MYWLSNVQVSAFEPGFMYAMSEWAVKEYTTRARVSAGTIAHRTGYCRATPSIKNFGLTTSLCIDNVAELKRIIPRLFLLDIVAELVFIGYHPCERIQSGGLCMLVEDCGVHT